MKKLLIILMFVPLVSFGQQAQATSVKVNTINKELAEKREAAIEITKPNSMNLDEIKGFVVSSATSERQWNGNDGVLRKSIQRSLEMTPFEVVTKRKDVKKFGLKKGYIYITLKQTRPDNNNYVTTWVFRNSDKRSVFSFTAVNKDVTEVLSEIGISTY